MRSDLRSRPGLGVTIRVSCRAQDLVALPQPRLCCPSEGTNSGLSCPEQRSPGPEHLLGQGKGLAKGKMLPRSPSSFLSREPRAEFGCKVQLWNPWTLLPILPKPGGEPTLLSAIVLSIQTTSAPRLYIYFLTPLLWLVAVQGRKVCAISCCLSLMLLRYCKNVRYPPVGCNHFTLMFHSC